MTPEQFSNWRHYAEVEPFGMDEGDFRAMALNSLIAGIVGAKIPPEDFTLRRFVERIHETTAEVVDDEARLDLLLGVRSRDEALN